MKIKRFCRPNVLSVFLCGLLLFVAITFWFITNLREKAANPLNSMGVMELNSMSNRADSLLQEIKKEREALHALLTQNENENENENAEATEKKFPKADGNSKSVSSPTAAFARSDKVAAFKDHRILGFSDEEFGSTSIDQMMSWYGEADGGGSCAGDFGNSLVNRWRETRKPGCVEKPGASLKSSIDCFLVRQTRHHGNGDNLVLMNNVAVDMGIFGNRELTNRVVEEYVGTRHANQPYIHFPMGFVQGQCSPEHDQWTQSKMPGWNADWTTSAFQELGNDKTESDICEEWVEHPVLVIQRDTFANFFHDSEDFFNAFLALAILRWRMDNVQIYLTDLYPKGPFWDIWSKPFSGKYPALDAFDLMKKFGRDGQPYRVCFRQLAVGIYGPAAPVTVASWDTPCTRTALVRAYSDFVIRGMKLQSFSHYAQPAPSKTVVVTYLARRASTEWPEKKFCSDSLSFFRCELWRNWGIRSLGRMVQNDAEVVSSLKELEKLPGVTVRFQDVDFNLLTFEEQIKVDLETDILVGPHGAGLMHNIFMRDRAALIELSVDGSGGLRHFHNLAFWFGRRYLGVQTTNPIDINRLKKEIQRVIQGIDISHY